MLDPAAISRRYPWTDYKDAPKDPYMTSEQSHEFAKANWVATVVWVVPDSGRLNYGWRYETRSFANVDAALEAAKRPMGIARSVEVGQWDWDRPHGDPQRRVVIYSRKNANLTKRRARA